MAGRLTFTTTAGRHRPALHGDDAMTNRKPRARTIRNGARVIDGRGTGTARNNTGLPDYCDPRRWIWVDWDGSRGLQPARLSDIRATGSTTYPGKPFPDEARPGTTTERLAKVRECIAGAADDLYAIDRAAFDAQGWIALIGAANDIRDAERALDRLIGTSGTPAADAPREGA